MVVISFMLLCFFFGSRKSTLLSRWTVFATFDYLAIFVLTDVEPSPKYLSTLLKVESIQKNVFSKLFILSSIAVLDVFLGNSCHSLSMTHVLSWCCLWVEVLSDFHVYRCRTFGWILYEFSCVIGVLVDLVDFCITMFCSQPKSINV